MKMMMKVGRLESVFHEVVVFVLAATFSENDCFGGGSWPNSGLGRGAGVLPVV